MSESLSENRHIEQIDNILIHIFLNIILHRTMKHYFVFLVAPEKVTITGPKTAKVGDTLNFNCETANSNPRATVQWVVDGRTIHENYTHWVCTYLLL